MELGYESVVSEEEIEIAVLEYFEQERSKFRRGVISDTYLYGGSIYSIIGKNSIPKILNLLRNHNLTYDPTKLNPLFGNYSFLS